MEYAQRQARSIIQTLSLAELRDLDAWLHEWMAQSELVERLAKRESKRREVRQVKPIGSQVFQLELVNCGKCSACSSGRAVHGPYWYGYARINGKMKSWYCGVAPKTVDGQVIMQESGVGGGD